MKTKISIQSFIELKSMAQKVSTLSSILNEMEQGDVPEVSEMVLHLLDEVRNDLIVMGKRSLVVSLSNIKHAKQLGVFKTQVSFLMKAVKQLGVSTSQEEAAIPNAILAYKRKFLMIEALNAYILTLSEDEEKASVLEVAHDMVAKAYNALVSIEMSILSWYSAGKKKEYINEHLVIDENATSIINIKKWGTN